MKEQTKERQILNLLEMFDIQYQQAQKIYQAYDHDLKSAINHLLKRNREQRERKQENSSQQRKLEKGANLQEKASRHIQTMKKMRQKSPEQEQLQSDQKRQRFRKTYMIKKSKLSTYKRFNSKPEVPSCQNRLQNYLNQPITTKFHQEGNEIFEEIWNTRKFIAVHCLDIPRIINPKDIQSDIRRSLYRDIYCSQKFGPIFNKQFQNVVVDPRSPEYAEIKVINQFINPQKDLNCIIILRINEKQKLLCRAHSLNIITTIKPQNPDAFQKHIYHMRKDINRVIDSQICPSIHHNPLSDIQKIKLDQDRKIKAEQENAYKTVYEQMQHLNEIRKAEEKLKKQKLRQERQKQQQEQDPEIQQLKQQVMKSIQQSMMKEREDKRNAIKRYQKEEVNNPITIKIRYPNGQQQHLILPKTELLQYLIDFVTCKAEILGFENQLRRNFVFTQPWSSTDLQNMQTKTLLELFGQSEGQILIVKEVQ